MKSCSSLSTSQSASSPRGKFLRRQTVEELTGLSRSSIYHAIAEGHFPKPVAVGTKAVRWISSEIDEWMLARISARTQ
ncbi:MULTISPECIES: helix-turn-helix transcriptional regulator [Achromobacter]|uniref:helix-turn-helix transcriptional regulator n=1 Tax=Achromobacter TaxID=222 RepID=UPI0009F6B4CA|nr:AlpA family transcriptional regulator [Achromobacter sp. RW408]